MINPSTGVIRRAGNLKRTKIAWDAILLFSTVDSLVVMMASSKLVGRKDSRGRGFKDSSD